MARAGYAMEVTSFEDDRRPALVVSHERSGTHFTMNTLARCFGYISSPWIDLDRPRININYYAPSTLAEALLSLANYRLANVLKSHHEFRFFSEVIEPVSRAYRLIYVYRHPADTLASYWRLLNTMAWMEGPRSATALDFATTPPMGRLMRYQWRQYDDMLDRWANHVRGWLDAAQSVGDIHLVRYEDLHTNFEDRVRRLGAWIGLEPERIERPSRTKNVILGGGVQFDPAPGADNRAAIAALAARRHPDLMARLGYADDPSRVARAGAA
jgi:hypothetical protein